MLNDNHEWQAGKDLKGGGNALFQVLFQH